MMELSGYIACLCEGAAEEAIIDLLLDADLLKFKREQMIEEKPLRVRDAETFERRYLRMGFKETITVVRILDSHRERFKLDKMYSSKVSVINVVTAPEIEMLIILAEDRYNDYKKSGEKPSDFCKRELKMHSEVKSYRFVKDYFHDSTILVQAIQRYRQISSSPRGEYTLADLLR